MRKNDAVIEEIKNWLRGNDRRQYELAAEIGVPAPTVNRWLTGKCRISNAYLGILKSRGILR